MSKLLILVVDDDVKQTDMIAKLIDATGKYEAIKAYNGIEGLKVLSKNKIMLGLGGNRIRFIVLDIKMPEMDGLEFLARVRRDYGQDIGITLLTAYEDDEKWDRATSGFVVNYIKKPFKEEELIETIDKFFTGKEIEMTIKTFEKHIEKMDASKRPKI